jgi:DNA-binding response OmpR family regulator
VTKPFGRQELLARIDALLRRQRKPAAVRETYADDFVTIDFGRRTVVVAGKDVSLTPLEFRLLATFVEHPTQVLSRNQLLELVWGDTAAVSPDQVKLYVGYLRRKLGDNAPIETVRGFGYRYRTR